MEYEVLVYIGRFQPFHAGHKVVIEEALTKAKNVIVVLGSDGCARNVRNPFTSGERATMISDSFDAEDSKRIRFLPQRDYPYNLDRWYTSVRAGVMALTTSMFGFRDKNDYKIGIIGHDKDETSFYLRGFQNWPVVETNHFLQLDATSIRENYFKRLDDWSYDYHKLGDLVPFGTEKFLISFYAKEAYSAIQQEFDFIKRYKKEWEAAPYPPIFQTADSVVIKNACVLLVKRGHNPGKGLYALPGGFVNQKETIQTAAIRELKEETKIKVSKEELIKAIEKAETFDDPHRSNRGRTITKAFLIKLKNGGELPEVKGSDDAVEALWMPLDQLSRENMFDDHFHIIEELVGL